MDLPDDRMRKELSFNLSGPLALLACAWFFSKLQLSRGMIQKLLLCGLAPCLGIASLAIYGILTTPDIVFTTESNNELSGGFGPNQVATTLALGVVFAFWALLDERSSRGLRLVAAATMGLLVVQTALTYSRGGLYTAFGAIGAGLPFLMVDRRARMRVAVLIVAGLAVGRFVVLPRLDAFTQGTLVARFEQTDLTHRGEIGLAELELWREYPLFGVGPGGSLHHRAYRVAAHTEFSRLVAEHGTFGFLACLMLVLGAVSNLRAVRSPKDRAMVATLTAFGVLYMLGAGMRLAIPSFVIGLTFLRWPSHIGLVRTTRRVRRPAMGRMPAGSAV
jgi:O-antigen ligase